MAKIRCRDCNELTWNRTERCGPCRKIFNERKSMEPICSYSMFKGSAADMAANKARCIAAGCPSCCEEEGIMQSQEVIDHKYGKKVMSADNDHKCKECDSSVITLVDGVCNTCLSKTDAEDVIDWPKHYNTGKIQPIDAIEDWKLDFRLANAVKYIARHEHKGSAKKDLEKAIWYIQRFIDKELSND